MGGDGRGEREKEREVAHGPTVGCVQGFSLVLQHVCTHIYILNNFIVVWQEGANQQKDAALQEKNGIAGELSLFICSVTFFIIFIKGG